MTPDLLLPVIFIVIMYVIIGCVEDALTLLAIAALFIPVSFMFSQIVQSGGYTTLFGATLVSGIIAKALISFSMFLIPMYAIVKIFYIRRIMGDKHD